MKSEKKAPQLLRGKKNKMIKIAEDENGNDVPAQLEFTYDDATDIITFELDMFYAEDNTPLTLTLNFARN